MEQMLKSIALFFEALFMPKSKAKSTKTRKTVKRVRRVRTVKKISPQRAVPLKKKTIKEKLATKADDKKVVKRAPGKEKTSSTTGEKVSIDNLKVLRRGDQGVMVEQWQLFLVGQGYLKSADGDFGGGTKSATMKFQKAQGLTADGIVGNTCYGKAMMLGFQVIADNPNDKNSAYWPPKPDFQSLYNDEKRTAAFGKMEFTADEKGKLIITNGWKEENIITIDIPQLKGVNMWGRPKKSGNIFFHKRGAKQMKALWAEWEKENLLHLVKTWNGTYCARFIRGSKTKLSNHAYGTAFDINVKWNGLAKRPALIEEVGSVRELVQIAHKHGFYWGGHFRRKDGMHFELAKIL